MRRPGAPPETTAEQIVRFERQARILLGDEHAKLLDDLNQVQVAEIVGALYVAGSGLSPEAYVRWQQEQRRTGQMAGALALLENIEGLIIELSAELRRLPAEVDGMPLADAVSLRERLAALERQRTQTQAIIAGVKLTWNP